MKMAFRGDQQFINFNFNGCLVIHICTKFLLCQRWCMKEDCRRHMFWNWLVSTSNLGCQCLSHMPPGPVGSKLLCNCYKLSDLLRGMQIWCEVFIAAVLWCLCRPWRRWWLWWQWPEWYWGTEETAGWTVRVHSDQNKMSSAACRWLSLLPGNGRQQHKDNN